MRRLVGRAERMHERHRPLGVALGHHCARAALAFAALGGDTEVDLDVVKARARLGMADQGFVADTAANTDDHGQLTGEQGRLPQQAAERWH